METVQSECVIETDYDKEATPLGKPRRRASINQTPDSRFSYSGPGKIFERNMTPSKHETTSNYMAARKIEREQILNRYTTNSQYQQFTPINRNETASVLSYQSQMRSSTKKQGSVVLR